MFPARMMMRHMTTFSKQKDLPVRLPLLSFIPFLSRSYTSTAKLDEGHFTNVPYCDAEIEHFFQHLDLLRSSLHKADMTFLCSLQSFAVLASCNKLRQISNKVVT